MWYLINMLICVTYVYVVNTKYFEKKRIIKYLPLIIYLMLFIGSQEGVGTDYYRYLEVFSSPERLEIYHRISEYVFYYFVKTCWYFGLNGQSIFFVIGFIQSLLLVSFLEVIDLEEEWIFVLIFFVIGTSFYSQFNGLRSSTAAYLINIAIFSNSIVLKNSLFIVSLGIHRSMFIVYPFIFLDKFVSFFSKKILLIILVISVVILVLPIDQIFIECVTKILPSLSYYLKTDYFARIKFTGVILKILIIPLYVLSLNEIPKQNKEHKYFIIGFLLFCIRLACLRYSITNRIGEIFVLGSLLPLYYLFRNLLRKKETIKALCLFSPYLLLFLLKITILANNEYIYSSIFFK